VQQEYRHFLTKDKNKTLNPKPRKQVSQIWLHTREESFKEKGSFYILSYLLELVIKIWQFRKKNQSKSGKFG
jgi:hypothetical protein